MLVFQVTQPGAYRFSARYPEGKRGTEAVFAIGPDFGNRLFATVGISLLIWFVSVGGGTAIAVATLIKRRNAKAKLQNIPPQGGAQVSLQADSPH